MGGLFRRKREGGSRSYSSFVQTVSERRRGVWKALTMNHLSDGITLPSHPELEGLLVALIAFCRLTLVATYPRTDVAEGRLCAFCR